MLPQLRILPMSLFADWTRENSTCGWIIIFPAKIRFLLVSATTKLTLLYPAVRLVLLRLALSPVHKTFRTMAGMLQFRKLTFSLIAASTKSVLALTGSSTTSVRSATALANQPSWEFKEPTSTANALVLLRDCLSPAKTA